MFNQMDLRSLNAYTLYMYHSAKNMRAFLSNFTKMKRLELLSSGDNFRIVFYKDEILPFNTINKDDFTGPYFVSKELILSLLGADLLHVSFVRIIRSLEEIPEDILKHLANLKDYTTGSVFDNYDYDDSNYGDYDHSEDYEDYDFDEY
uniref:Uncharacterized protein n=1 Tax=Meloidogyne hapla TaxID=6305 RepID=A0A1I8BIB2_MELHA